MNIGKSIREKRIKKGWSQEELSERVFSPPHVISWWENEKYYPSLKKIILLADVFECSLDELVGRKWNETNI